jgi:hypothetical protein
MAAFLRAHDPHDHLVTTSFAVFVFDDAVWNGSGLDLSQLHFYSTIESSGGPVVLSPNLAQDVAQFSAIRRGATSQPVLFAELGVDARGPAETKASDPGGIGVHDGLFEGVAEGSARPLVARGLQGRRTLLLWLKDDAFQWYAPEPAEIAGATLRLDALPRGRWCGAWYDSWAGAEGEAVRVRGGRPATLAVPTFSRDLGLRLRRCKSAGN